MKNFNWQFSAGETKTFYGAYSKFRIIENSAGAASSVSVFFYSNQSDTDEDATNILAGYYAAPKNGFQRIDIKNNGIAQIINFCVYDGDGGYDRATGVFSVVGTVKTQEAGTAFSATFKSLTNMAANGVEAVFLPAANVNGVIVNSLNFLSNHATFIQTGGFYVRTAVPSASLDNGCISSSDMVSTTGSSVNSCGKLNSAILIPAGNGLWFFSNQAEAFAIRNCVYTIL